MHVEVREILLLWDAVFLNYSGKYIKLRIWLVLSDIRTVSKGRNLLLRHILWGRTSVHRSEKVFWHIFELRSASHSWNHRYFWRERCLFLGILLKVWRLRLDCFSFIDNFWVSCTMLVTSMFSGGSRIPMDIFYAFLRDFWRDSFCDWDGTYQESGLSFDRVSFSIVFLHLLLHRSMPDPNPLVHLYWHSFSVLWRLAWQRDTCTLDIVE